MFAVRSWKNLRVWVLGASTGIGRALADELAKRGAMLALSARRAAPLEALAAELGGPPHKVLPLDVTNAEAVAEATRALVDAWGGIDMVVINAGTYAPLRAADFSLEQVNAILDVNLRAPFNVLHAVLPQMLRQPRPEGVRGHVVLVGSVAGYRGLPKALAYGPSKAALINLAEVLNIDLMDDGIDVRLVSPGFVKTPLTDQNDFEMPGLITAAEAATHIANGLQTTTFEIHFPKRFTLFMNLLRHLPHGLYVRAVRRMTGL
jgi:short-subunit dehydrogenase